MQRTGGGPRRAVGRHALQAEHCTTVYMYMYMYMYVCPCSKSNKDENCNLLVHSLMIPCCLDFCLFFTQKSEP